MIKISLVATEYMQYSPSNEIHVRIIAFGKHNFRLVLIKENEKGGNV